MEPVGSSQRHIPHALGLARKAQRAALLSWQAIALAFNSSSCEADAGIQLARIETTRRR